RIMGGNSFKTIWFFFKPYKLRIMLLFGLSLLVGVLEAVNVAAIFPILSTAFAPGVEQDNVIFNSLQGIAALLPVANEFLAYSVVFLIVALLAFVAKMVSITYRVKFGANLVQRNQAEIFQKFLEADYQYFIDHKQGELIYNVSSAPQLLMTLINAVMEVTAQAILSISILLLLFSLSWQGTLVVILVGLGYHYFTRYLGGRVAYTSGKGELQALQESNVILNEAISGIKQVKVYAVGEAWQSRFLEVMRQRWYHFIRRDIWRQIPTPLLMLVLYLAIGIIAVSVKLVATGNVLLLLPVFGTFAFAVFRLFPIIGTVGTYTMQIMGALPNCEVVYAIHNDELAHLKDGTREIDAFHSEIRFENVTFSYHHRTRIVEDVSFTFKKGETTAIVGRYLSRRE
ncbi:ABC transporter transmembrane domain-containing protein, partial [Chloroflexota bacterium]